MNSEPKDKRHDSTRSEFGPPQKDSFLIGGETVEPGTRADIAIPVSDLSSGTPVSLNLRVMHGRYVGPTIFVSAAIHGDEIIGTEIIRRLLPKLSPKRLAGTIIFAPVVNFFGFASHSRYLPDGRDLNRCFPGNPNGSLASQLAYIFRTEVLQNCSLGIDLHSAGEHRYNLPQIRIEAGLPHLFDLAMAFGTPAVIESPLREGSMRHIARGEDVDMLLLETGEALRIDELSVRFGVSGILRVLRHLGMIRRKNISKVAATPAHSTRTTWVRSPRGGICTLKVKSGARVHMGDPLAVVADVMGDGPEIVPSPIDGIIIGHSSLPVVNQGDALLHIAEVKAFDSVHERLGTINDSLLSDVMLDEDEVI